jgi:hypothetical protein
MVSDRGAQGACDLVEKWRRGDLNLVEIDKHGGLSGRNSVAEQGGQLAAELAGTEDTPVGAQRDHLGLH